MSFWRLTVARPNGIEETFDLPEHRSLSVGDSGSADICIETTEVPSNHKIVFSKGGRPRLRLTNEIISTLEGQLEELKVWRSRLYKGKDFEVNGPCQFLIGDAVFKFDKVDEVKLGGRASEMDEDEKKAWRESVLTSVGVHAALFLIFFIIGLITYETTPPKEELEQVTIAQVDKIFKKLPKPVEVENAQPQPEETKPIETAKNEPVKETEKASTKPAQENQPSKAHTKANSAGGANDAAGRKGNLPKRDVTSTGLLAIQSSTGPSNVTLSVASPNLNMPQNQKDLDKSIGIGNPLGKEDGEFGIGTGKSNQHEIARLGSISGEGYGGGIGAKVGDTHGTPGIHLVRREIEVRGGLDPAVIRQIIEERLSEIQYCYETSLLKHANLQGKIATSWTINGDGTVSNISTASDEIQQSVLHPCVREQILKWKFPEPKGNGVVHVKYPFVFSPIGG